MVIRMVPAARLDNGVVTQGPEGLPATSVPEPAASSPKAHLRSSHSRWPRGEEGRKEVGGDRGERERALGLGDGLPSSIPPLRSLKDSLQSFHLYHEGLDKKSSKISQNLATKGSSRPESGW